MALLPAFPDPVNVSLTLRQGATFQRDFTWKIGGVGVDITGATVRGKVRPDFATAPTLTLTCTLVDAANGKFRVKATPTDIATIPVPSDTPVGSRLFSAGQWDVEIQDTAGDVVRIIEGDASVSREATT